MKLPCLKMIFALWAIAFGGHAQAETFSARCAALAEDAASQSKAVVIGENDWLFLASELRHIGAGRFRGGDRDPAGAIVDFQRQLAGVGLELLLVPVPPKALISHDQLFTGGGPSPDEAIQLYAEFYDSLREQGVQVLDLTEEFLKVNQESGQDIPLFCRQDSHWSPRAIEMASSNIAAIIRARAWLGETPKMDYDLTEEPFELTGDLWLMLEEPRPAKETLSIHRVNHQGEPIKPSRASPVLLLGDSHTLIFHAGGDMLTTGAGLPDHLAAALGFPVDVLGVRGSGATPARINLMRRVRANPEYLAGKKVIVWCFSAREFTEAEWAPVPVTGR